VKWAKAHPSGIILDIGCSVGTFSLVALFADPSVELIAFGSDLSSLAVTLRLCRFASGDRLRLVRALLTDRQTSNQALDGAIRETTE